MRLPTLEELAPYVEQGLVTARPWRGLTVYNYTDRCTYSGAWDAVTRQCRGLILDAQGACVALPWPKFFNVGEPGAEALPERPPDDITVKEDGSLGLGFVHAGEVWWSTRGSLTSAQAEVARRLWAELHGDVPLEALAGLTLMAEIVGPETQVILRYGTPRLILLGARRLADGHDLRREEVLALGARLGMPVVEAVEAEVPALREAAARMGSDEEGFVCRWGRLRLKIKSAGYLRVSRLVMGFTERRVADRWVHQQPLPEELPEEVRMWAEAQLVELDAELSALEAEARDLAVRYDSPRALAAEQRTHRAFPAAARWLRGQEADLRALVYRGRFGSGPRPAEEL